MKFRWETLRLATPGRHGPCPTGRVRAVLESWAETSGGTTSLRNGGTSRFGHRKSLRLRPIRQIEPVRPYNAAGCMK